MHKLFGLNNIEERKEKLKINLTLNNYVILLLYKFDITFNVERMTMKYKYDKLSKAAQEVAINEVLSHIKTFKAYYNRNKVNIKSFIFDVNGRLMGGGRERNTVKI